MIEIQLSLHSNRSYETSSRKIRDLKIRRWQQQRMTSKKKKKRKETITGLAPVHTDRGIFETAYFVIQIGVDRDLNHFGTRFQADAVSVGGFTGFVERPICFKNL